MTTENLQILREKILSGINLAFERLVIAKKKENSELVFSKDEQIIRIKAKDIVAGKVPQTKHEN